MSSCLIGLIFSCIVWKTTYNTGITNTPRMVPINSPMEAPVAIDLLPTAPIPLAKTNGKRPKINANDVIKIGRNLAFAALMADSTIVSP